uniref:Protein phosphatase 1 regulatory inhibitor subunit 16B-like n=1 Tax=Phallusia mammillata TaxID=59560 RepID=A0A6F9DNR0_9ASCI|nr:protein phosphatase 1 regulatory inhibitor subunit 16B-like [Phallusia mammillata]
MVSHASLVAELAVVNGMSTEERLNHAQRRRADQVRRWNEYDQSYTANNNNVSKKKSIKFGDCITLLEGAARNDYDEVNSLLKHKVNPNEANDDGLTALHQACIDNFEDIVVLLLNNGANVNAVDSEFWTPLHAACTCGHTNIASVLVKRGADLLALNADNNMPYDICEEDDTLEFIELAMAQKGITQAQINTARCAKEQEILKEVTKLQESGGDITMKDKAGATVLHVAAANGYIDLTRYFLLHTTDPNIQDKDGWTPLHAAACWCQLEIVEILGVEFQADPSIKNNLGEVPSDVTEDEEIKALLAKLKTQKKKKPTLLFRRNNQPGSTRVNGIRGQSFKRMSRRDKKQGISAVEAKSEAQFWSGSQDSTEADISLTTPTPSTNQLPIRITKSGNAPAPQLSPDDDETPPRDVTDNDIISSDETFVPTKLDNGNRNGSTDPDKNGSAPQQGETLADVKRRRARNMSDVTGGDVTDDVIVSGKLSEQERSKIYGSKRRKKKSCAIL